MQDTTQGFFKSNGKAKILKIPTGVTFLEVLNRTQIATTQTAGRSFRFQWYKGLANGQGFAESKSNSGNAVNAKFLSSGGFTLIDASKPLIGKLNKTVTAISTATPPVVTNTGTNGLSAGDIVRLVDVVSAKQLGGIDFTVGNSTLSGTTFSLDYAPTIATAGTSGGWRKIQFIDGFYPSARVITSFSQATQAVLKFSVTHPYQVGQQLRITVPEKFKMVEADMMVATVTAIDTSANTVTLDLDSSGFTAFAFPANGDVPFTPAQVAPIGKGTTIDYANLWGSSLTNTGYIGIELAAGINGPAGSNNDEIFWRAISIHD